MSPSRGFFLQFIFFFFFFCVYFMVFEIKWEEGLSKSMSLAALFGLSWRPEWECWVLGAVWPGSSLVQTSLLPTPGQELIMEFLVVCYLQGSRGRAGQTAWLSVPAGRAGRALDPIAVSLSRPACSGRGFPSLHALEQNLLGAAVELSWVLGAGWLWGARVAASPCRGVSDPAPQRVCYPPALLLQPCKGQSMGSLYLHS